MNQNELRTCNVCVAGDACLSLDIVSIVLLSDTPKFSLLSLFRRCLMRKPKKAEKVY